jgi:hypothetical protein
MQIEMSWESEQRAFLLHFVFLFSALDNTSEIKSCIQLIWQN